jgi:uridine phosphorylase
VTLASLFGRRGGSICSVADNISTGEEFRAGAGHAAAIDVALEGIALLHRMDRAATAAGLPMWLPGAGLAPEEDAL